MEYGRPECLDSMGANMIDGSDCEAFGSGFRALSQKVAAALFGTPPPRVVGWNVTFSDDGEQVALSDGLVEEPGFLVGNSRDAIEAFAEFSSLREAASNSAVLRVHLASDPSTGDTVRNDVFWMRISGLLNSALAPDFAYDITRVDGVLSQLYAEMNSSAQTYVVRAYFRSSGPRLEATVPFSSIGEIRTMGNDERAKLVRSLRFYSDAGLPASVASMFRSVLELRFDSTANILNVTLPRPLGDYQTALRLVVGRVAFAFASIEQVSVFGVGHRRTLVPNQKTFWFGDQLALLPAISLTEVDVERACELLDKLATAPNARLIASAVRRFNDALERTRLDDALIDCVVGLESILTREEKSEVLRRLRQRLAFIIGRSADDRAAVYGSIPKIYDARSRIAHGETPTVPLWDLLSLAEDYLSRLLSSLLQASKKFDPAAVDVSLVRGDDAVSRDL